MALRGAKPKVTALKSVMGNPGKRPLDKKEGEKKSGTGFVKRTEPLAPMKKLTKVQREIWDRWVNPAWWLNDFDVPKAHSWVVAKAKELGKPKEMTVGERNQIRLLESELCFDVNERIRRGIQLEDDADPVEGYFD